jgi:hypothetical protein
MTGSSWHEEMMTGTARQVRENELRPLFRPVAFHSFHGHPMKRKRLGEMKREKQRRLFEYRSTQPVLLYVFSKFSGRGVADA